MDEAVFTFNTFVKKAWSAAYQTIDVVEAKVNIRAHAIISAISSDVGIEHYLTHPKSISTDQFVKFLEQLS